MRESFKGQMGALVSDSLKPDDSGAAALGAMLGLALVNQAVDAFVRPEVVMRDAGGPITARWGWPASGTAGWNPIRERSFTPSPC